MTYEITDFNILGALGTDKYLRCTHVNYANEQISRRQILVNFGYNVQR